MSDIEGLFLIIIMLFGCSSVFAIYCMFKIDELKTQIFDLKLEKYNDEWVIK